MQASNDTLESLQGLAGLEIRENVALSELTRFGIGGPARMLVDALDEQALVAALRALQNTSIPHTFIGGGSNLVVSDNGFDGIVLRYRDSALERQGRTVRAAAGVVLQDLVDFSIENGLSGIHTMTGIPGWTGAAVYGNAGAYGRSIDLSVRKVRYFDGKKPAEMNQADCRFHYRESIFKKNKSWIILSTELELAEGSRDALRTEADDILKVRNAKYPPDMKCAGSIFKNLILSELDPSIQARVPAKVIREGKVPSAYFLEEAGAKGLRNGGIKVADYHANLIYNEGGGTAAQLREVISELKERVVARFGLMLEEEVQYVGFDPSAPSAFRAR